MADENTKKFVFCLHINQPVEGDNGCVRPLSQVGPDDIVARCDLIPPAWDGYIKLTIERISKERANKWLDDLLDNRVGYGEDFPVEEQERDIASKAAYVLETRRTGE